MACLLHLVGPLGLTFLARADIPKVIVRIDPAAMPVIPKDLQSVVSRRFDVEHLDGRLKHRKRSRGSEVVSLLRNRAMRTRTRGARAFITQVRHWEMTMVTVLPVNIYAL